MGWPAGGRQAETRPEQEAAVTPCASVWEGTHVLGETGFFYFFLLFFENHLTQTGHRLNAISFSCVRWKN